MSLTGIKQPSEEKAFDIDMSNELLRSDETISSVISIESSPTGLSFGTVSIVSAKLLRVVISSGTDGTTYKVTTTIATNYSPVIEKENYIVVVET